PGGRAEDPVAEADDEQDAGESGERRPKPRSPVVHAEQLEETRGGPVLQRRLLEVLEAVEARRDPVAGGDHLARNLRVARFVRLVERAQPQRAEPGCRERGNEKQPHPKSSAAATFRSSATRML